MKRRTKITRANTSANHPTSSSTAIGIIRNETESPHHPRFVYTTVEEDRSYREIIQKFKNTNSHCPVRQCNYQSERESEKRSHATAHFYRRVCACGVVCVTSSQLDVHRTPKKAKLAIEQRRSQCYQDGLATYRVSFRMWDIFTQETGILKDQPIPPARFNGEEHHVPLAMVPIKIQQIQRFDGKIPIKGVEVATVAMTRIPIPDSFFDQSNSPEYFPSMSPTSSTPSVDYYEAQSEGSATTIPLELPSAAALTSQNKPSIDIQALKDEMAQLRQDITVSNQMTSAVRQGLSRILNYLDEKDEVHAQMERRAASIEATLAAHNRQ